MTDAPKQRSDRCWEPADEQAVLAALQRRNARRRQPITLTLVFKIHNPSQRKRQQLLDVHVAVTNSIAMILEWWREYPHQPRANGIVGMVISQNQRSENHRSRYIASEMQKAYTARVKADITAPLLPIEIFATGLMEASFREAARNVLLWVTKLTQQISELESYHEQELTVDQFFAGWRTLTERFAEAGATIIPFGRNRGQPLADHGRREARWIAERLLSQADIKRTIKAIDAIVERSGAEVLESMLIDSPFHQRSNRRRRVGERRILQRIIEPRDDRVVLGSLSTNDLKTLRDELLEMSTSTIRDTEALTTARDTLKSIEPHLTGLDELRAAITRFLSARPAEYPTIAFVDLTEEGQQERSATYAAWLRRFALEYGDDPEKVLSEEQERTARNGLLRAAGDLLPQRLQPITFIRTLRPEQYRGFALLLDQEDRAKGKRERANGTRKPDDSLQQPEVVKRKAEADQREPNDDKPITFVLAAVLRRLRPLTRVRQRAVGLVEGDHAVGTEPSTPQPLQQPPRLRLYRSALRFANFPATEYQHRSDLIDLFTLECGKGYQERILRELISDQREVQQREFEQLPEEQRTNRKVEDHIPKAVPIAHARIVATQDAADAQEFFAHLTARLPAPQPLDSPTAILAVVEGDRYAYALVGSKGSLLALGDIPILEHVDPDEGATAYTNNYIHALGIAVAREAANAQALVVFEDTEYQRAEVSLDRDTNRHRFRRPARRIAEVIEQHVVRKGLAAPLTCYGIHWAHDCGQCGARLPKGTKCLRRVQTASCPRSECNITLFRFRASDPAAHCPTCRTAVIWSKEHDYETVFACPACRGATLLERHNRAIVVARRALSILVTPARQATSTLEASRVAEEDEDHEWDQDAGLSNEPDTRRISTS